VGLARTGVSKKDNRLAGVHVPTRGEVAQRRGADSGDGVDVEVGQAFEAGKLGLVDGPGAAPVTAVVDLRRQDLGEELQVGLVFAGGDLGQPGRFGADGGQVQPSL
jgi:hypothetical protein